MQKINPVTPPLFFSPSKPHVLNPHKSRQGDLATNLLDEINKAQREKFTASRQVLTFKEFLQEVIKNPKKYLRSSSQYAVDAIDFWNKAQGVNEGERLKVLGHEIKPIAFAKRPWEPPDLVERSTIAGQELVLNEIYNTLKTNAKKKHPTSMIILHGPNATGKTLILETLFEALNHYSRQEEGILYTFNWVFKDDDEGFESLFPVYSTNKIKLNENTTQSEEVVTIPANLNTNPIFLLSKENRVKLLRDLEKQGTLDETFNKDYIISGELDSCSQKIMDALWKLYEGDTEKILNHIQVVRWTLSEKNRKGLVVIQPEETSEANLIPITPDIDWSSLPSSINDAFRAAGLHEIEGPIPQANRGHIFFDDMMKGGDLSRYLFLLRTAEKGKISISTGNGSKSADELLDVIIWGATNDSTLYTLQQKYADWDSLKERFTFIPVGYERCYKSVAKIYEDQLKQHISPGRHISPHALDSFSLWNTMTYLFPPQDFKYYDSLDINEDTKKLIKSSISKMKPDPRNNTSNILHKALLYQGEDINSYELDPNKQRFSTEEKIALNKYLKEIASEYNLGVGKNKFILYEGSTGLSPREGRNILDETIKTKQNECFSPLEVFDAIGERIKHGLDFEEERKDYLTSAKTYIEEATRTNKSLSLPSIPDPVNFPSSSDLLKQVIEHTKRKIRFDISSALGFIKNEEEHINNLRKYIEHIKAEFNKLDVPPNWREPSYTSSPNERFMREMEKIFNPQGFSDIESTKGRSEFRQKIREEMGLWTGSHEGENPVENLHRIFPDLTSRMKSKDIEDNKEKLFDFLYDLETYYSQRERLTRSDLTAKMKERIELLNLGLSNLKRMDFCDRCIPKLIDFAFDEDLYKEAIASRKGKS